MIYFVPCPCLLVTWGVSRGNVWLISPSHKYHTKTDKHDTQGGTERKCYYSILGTIYLLGKNKTCQYIQSISNWFYWLSYGNKFDILVVCLGYWNIQYVHEQYQYAIFDTILLYCFLRYFISIPAFHKYL